MNKGLAVEERETAFSCRSNPRRTIHGDWNSTTAPAGTSWARRHSDFERRSRMERMTAFWGSKTAFLCSYTRVQGGELSHARKSRRKLPVGTT